MDVVLDDARPELLWNQLTGGSNSVHSLYTPMRAVAAAARARLVTAAARRFGVDGARLVTRDATPIDLVELRGLVVEPVHRLFRPRGQPPPAISARSACNASA